MTLSIYKWQVSAGQALTNDKTVYRLIDQSGRVHESFSLVVSKDHAILAGCCRCSEAGSM